jgi:hypothetical protein
MLNGVPVLAVMVEDVGQRGAHRTAYLDFVASTESAAFQKCMAMGGDEAACRVQAAGAGEDTFGLRNSQQLFSLGLAAAFTLGLFAVAKFR